MIIPFGVSKLLVLLICKYFSLILFLLKFQPLGKCNDNVADV